MDNLRELESRPALWAYEIPDWCDEDYEHHKPTVFITMPDKTSMFFNHTTNRWNKAYWTHRRAIEASIIGVAEFISWIE